MTGSRMRGTTQSAGGYRLNDGRVSERTGLGGQRREVLQNGVHLLPDQFRFQRKNAVDARCVLDRNQSHGRSAVNMQLVKVLRSA